MIDRRALLLSGMASAALPSALKAAHAFTPADPVRDFMRMHSTLGGTAVWTMEGLIQGAMPGETARPLIRFHSLVEVHVREPEPGLFRTEQREATWLTDIASGEVATSFTNPYTGENNVPFGYVTPLNVYFFDKTGSYQRELPAERKGVFHQEWGRGGTTIWLSENRYNVYPAGIDEAEFPRAYAGPQRVSVDIISYQARYTDFARKGGWVPVTTHMTTSGPWPYWLMMGRRPGNVIWTGHGEKYRRLADVPAAMRDTCEQVYPGFVANPFAYPEREMGTGAMMRRLRAAGKL